MRRSIIVLTALVLAAPLVHAHFPMLIVDRPFLAPGDEVTIDFTIGHPYVNDRFAAERPTRVRVFTPLGGAQDLTARVTTQTVTFQDEALQSHRVAFTPRKTGDYVFSWELKLFNEPPKRLVIDFAKVVVHVGEDQIGWWQKVGTPIEIVPLTRPYAIKPGDTFRGQVFEGRGPMMGGVVEGETYTDVMPYPAPELAFTRRAERTDSTGAFSMTLDRAGWWLISVASDGGPGEQGSLDHPAQRAVLWVYVGGP
jgi:cobalt/nickel transport protein